MRNQAVLPSPEPQALAASLALRERVAGRIRAAGGWIGFDEYMALALYEPGLGYYAGGSRKFGPAGDFITAPESSDLFGACLARQCAQWFEACAARVIEFGAGSGALAAQVLAELERLGCGQAEYWIVELSGELAARQRETLARLVPQALPRVRWLTAWPERIDGVVLANELLDAMPVRAFQCEPAEGGGPAKVFERGVVLADAPPASDAGPTFGWALRAADPDFEARVREALAQGWGAEDGPVGFYQGELAEQAQAWVRQLGERLERGAALLIDYGFAAAEFYHPQRAMGTLMCHYRHHAHGDPFLHPGLQDITAHVDFSAVARAAAQAGLSVLGYTSQARLLTNLGLIETLTERHRAGDADPLAWARQAQSVQRLLSEAEMGELFKAIALGRDPRLSSDGFARGDRREALAT